MLSLRRRMLWRMHLVGLSMGTSWMGARVTVVLSWRSLVVARRVTPMAGRWPIVTDPERV